MVTEKLATAQQKELERDDLRDKVTSQNLRREVLIKQNGHASNPRYWGRDV